MTYYKDTDIAKRFDVCRITIWRWVKNNDFPKPVKLSPGCTRWKEDDIINWEVTRTKAKSR